QQGEADQKGPPGKAQMPEMTLCRSFALAVRDRTVLSLFYLAGTLGGRGHNNLRCEARCLLVRAGHVALKFGDGFRPDQVNRAATEAAARHSCSEHPGQL